MKVSTALVAALSALAVESHDGISGSFNISLYLNGGLGGGSFNESFGANLDISESINWSGMNASLDFLKKTWETSYNYTSFVESFNRTQFFDSIESQLQTDFEEVDGGDSGSGGHDGMSGEGSFNASMSGDGGFSGSGSGSIRIDFEKFKQLLNFTRSLEFNGSSLEEIGMKQKKFAEGLKECADKLKNETFTYRKESKSHSEHQLDIQADANSTDKTPATTLKLQFESSGMPGLRLSVGTDLTKLNSTDFTGASIHMGFYSLVETSDTISVSQSSHGFNFSDFQNLWTALDVQDKVSGGVSYTQATTTLSPGGSWGTLKVTLSLYYSASIAVLPDGTVLNPNALKYGLEIADFPYALNNGRISLVKRLGSRSGFVSKTNEILMGPHKFEWDATVIADGIVANVTLDAVLVGQPGADNLEGEAVRVLTFSFPALANDIVWDPQMEVDQSSVSSGNQASTGSGSPAPPSAGSTGGKTSSASTLELSLMTVAAGLIGLFL